MKIMYLTWGETPKKSGIFGSQVIQQLVETSKLDNPSNFILVSGLPVINSGFVFQNIKYINEIKTVRQRLHGIKHKIIGIISPQNWFYSKKYEFTFFHFFSSNILEKYIKKFQPDVIHCRSYHATWAALKIRQRTQIKFKVIFDARGLWPEEGILKKRIKLGDPNYLFMKEVERFLLATADVTIAVSDTMAEHYARIGVKKCEIIYLSAPTSPPPQKTMDNTSGGYFHYCYVGALAENTWHSPQALVTLYEQLRLATPNSKLTIITQSNIKKLKKYFEKYPTDEIAFTSTNSTKELHEILTGFDIGLLPYMPPTNEIEHVIANTVLATKTVEYLSAGLPVITNTYCGGATRLVQKFNVGIAYRPTEMQNDLTAEKIHALKDFEIKQRATSISNQHFSYQLNAKKYFSLYQQLCQNA